MNKVYYEVLDLDNNSFESMFPAFINQDWKLMALAAAADKIFEDRSSHPIFNLGAALDEIREGTLEFEVQEVEVQKFEEIVKDDVVKIALEEAEKEVEEVEKEKEVGEIAKKENPVLPMSERIKSLQAGIKIAMPGGMPNRKASNIQIERQVEKEAGETSAPVSAYTAKGRLRSMNKDRPMPKNRRLPTVRRD